MLTTKMTLECGAPGSELELSLFGGLLEASGLQSFCTYRRRVEQGPWGHT